MTALWYNASTKRQCAGVLATPGAWSKPLTGSKEFQQVHSITPQGFVYIISAKGLDLVKIGFSQTPHSRLNALQTGSPVELELFSTWRGTERDERELHCILAEFRTKREWFSLSPQEASRRLDKYFNAPEKHEHICSFCGLDSTQVDLMVTSPKADICSECVELCIEIFAEHKRGQRKKRPYTKSKHIAAPTDAA
jgi:hypothetical protein